MGAIKEFFHDEICALAEGEDLHIDEAYMQKKWEEQGETFLQFMEADFEEMMHSGVPRHLSKFK